MRAVAAAWSKRWRRCTNSIACADSSLSYLSAMSKERYIAAKQKWAEKQKAKGVTARAVASHESLPPGPKITGGFPPLELGVQPDIPHSQWRLKVDGLVEKPSELSWKQFHALPQVE